MQHDIDKFEQRIVDELINIAIHIERVANAKVAAAIVMNRQIIYGFTQKKSHPLQAEYSKNPSAIYLHAEIHAISRALRMMSTQEFINARKSLYIVRVKRPSDSSNDWTMGLAKPCNGCVKAIEFYNFQHVVYSMESDGQDQRSFSITYCEN